MSTDKDEMARQDTQAEEMSQQFERAEDTWRSEQRDDTPAFLHLVGHAAPFAPTERLQAAYEHSKQHIAEARSIIAVSHDVVAASHAAIEVARVLCDQAPGETRDDDGQQGDSALCHQCGTPVHRREAHAITVEADGALRLWTAGRAATFMLSGQGHTPILHDLCTSCTDDLFGNEAQTDVAHVRREVEA